MKKKTKTIHIVLLTGLLFWFGPGPVGATRPLPEKEPLVLTRQGEFLVSPMLRESAPFNAAILRFDRAFENLEVNFNPGNENTWITEGVDDDGYGPDSIIFHEPSTKVQFRKRAAPNENRLVGELTLLPYRPEEFREKNRMVNIANWLAGPAPAGLSYRVIKRSEWGADESLRLWNPDLTNGVNGTEEKSEDACGEFIEKYSDELGVNKTVTQDAEGNQYLWPLSYSSKIRKIVVHHTDSDIRDLNGDLRTDSLDMKAMVRAIYRFHAVTHQWGDIGYNYLIDPMGNIYEGRYGGEGVIGAHVRCHNNGTIGIAVIGNYHENELPEPARQALIYLVGQKAKLYGLDPEKQTSFRGKTVPNVVGHRDLRPTACPGDYLYGLLPDLRKRIALFMGSASLSDEALAAATLDYNAEVVSEINVINLHPTNRHKQELKFKNIGKKTWDRNTWLHVSLNNQAYMEVVPLLPDKRFVAAAMKEDSVPPGSIGTFTVEFAAGYKAGFYTFELAPVINGRYKISRAGVVMPLKIDEPQFDYEVVRASLPSGTLFQGEKLEASIELLNQGNITWRNYGDHPIAIGTDHSRDRKSVFIKENPSRLAYLKQSEVPPGTKGKFIFTLDVPRSRVGKVREYFTPVIEGVQWLEDKQLSFETTIKKPVHKAQITKKTNVTTLMPGETRELEIEIENQGDLRWTEEVMDISLRGQGIKLFKNKIVPIEPVLPKQKATYRFWIQAPYESGNFSVSLRSRFNGIAIRGGMARFAITVPKMSLRAKLEQQNERNVTVAPNKEKKLTVKFKNIGNAVWRNKGNYPLLLAPSRPEDRLSRLFYEKGWENKYRAAKLKEAVVNPGEIGTFEFTIKPAKGVYQEYFQLIIENVGWIESSTIRWDIRAFKSDSGSDGGPNGRSNGSNTNIQPPSEPQSEQRSDPPSESIRIKLSYEAPATTITVRGDYRVEDEAGKTLYEVADGSVVDVNIGASVVNLHHGANSKSKKILRLVPTTPEGVIEISGWERRPAWNQKLNDNQFRGALEMQLADNKPTYINELTLEDYLKGLAESNNSQPFEKQKAIAVLARSYARFYMDPAHRKFPGLPYDGSDDPDVFQKYLGYSYEQRSENFVDAVVNTKNEVVTYKGALIKTPYFNQSDGRTRSAEEVWGWKDTPYLKSVDDPWCEEKILKGHGVGLSGCGATELAKQGKKYKEIIQYYYTGVEIGKP